MKERMSHRRHGFGEAQGVRIPGSISSIIFTAIAASVGSPMTRNLFNERAVEGVLCDSGGSHCCWPARLERWVQV